MNKAHVTAIARNKPSRPLRYLIHRGKLRGRLLDFGCGKGFDGRYVDAVLYDPYYFPAKPRGKFDTIVCNYVLNVIPHPNERDEVVRIISKLLTRNGNAYITVRNDRSNLNGWTSRGSWQGGG